MQSSILLFMFILPLPPSSCRHLILQLSSLPSLSSLRGKVDRKRGKEGIRAMCTKEREKGVGAG